MAWYSTHHSLGDAWEGSEAMRLLSWPLAFLSRSSLPP